ncbi:MBL fold metallo-hydrolase [Micromonospora sp. SH-82]|uniref:MBL fold metallo-hydrolase n=1 Tax=Micromonospora sp. SH-82 TaxID=3132938 RepID=UPI003EB85F4B
MSLRFVEVADRVYVLREPQLRVNVTLICGEGAALLVDTLSTPGQAAALAAAAREVTPHPWSIVNTHHHFDHCFGNATLAGDPPCPVWAHPLAAEALREQPGRIRREGAEEIRAELPGLAAELAEVEVLAPNRTVRTEEWIDVGGRPVLLRHPGRGHTAGDVVVRVPDAAVLVAGDLVEQGAPPDFADSYPLHWPEAVTDLLRSSTPETVVIPGHGDPVDVAFVQEQHSRLAELAWLIRAAHTAGAPPERVAAEAPFGSRAALTAARRGYRHLDGED